MAWFSVWSAPDSRLWSGSFGSSTLITSAPRTASWYAANGPARTWVQSRILIPSNGRMKFSSCMFVEGSRKCGAVDLQLRDKVAVIGGASKGLGRACAEVLAQEGVKVTLCSRSQADLDKAAKEIRDTTG